MSGAAANGAARDADDEDDVDLVEGAEEAAVGAAGGAGADVTIAGGDGAGAVAVEDADELDVATCADMPLGLHPSVQSVWAFIKSKPTIRIVVRDGALYLQPSKSHLRAIAYALFIEQKDDGGIYVNCRLHGCGNPTKITNPDGTLNQTNAIKHYIRCGGMLTHEWALALS